MARARTSSRTRAVVGDVELGVVDDRQARAVPAGHPAVDAGHLLVGEAAVAAALGVALQDDLQAGQQHDRQQAGAHMPLPAAEADDRAVGEDRVVEDAGDAVGQEVAGGEAAGAAGEAVLGLGVVVPAGLRVGEAGADPFADVVEADVRGGHPAVVGPVTGDAGLAGARPGRSAARRAAVARRRGAASAGGGLGRAPGPPGGSWTCPVVSVRAAPGRAGDREPCCGRAGAARSAAARCGGPRRPGPGGAAGRHGGPVGAGRGAGTGPGWRAVRLRRGRRSGAARCWCVPSRLAVRRRGHCRGLGRPVRPCPRAGRRPAVSRSIASCVQGSRWPTPSVVRATAATTCGGLAAYGFEMCTSISGRCAAAASACRTNSA